MNKNDFYYVTVWSHANLDYKGYITKGNAIASTAVNLKICITLEQAQATIEKVKEAYKEHINVLEFEIKRL